MNLRRQSGPDPEEGVILTSDEDRATVEARLAALEDVVGTVRRVRSNPPPVPHLDGDVEDTDPLPRRNSTSPTREELTIQTAETLARLRILEQRLRIGDAS